MSGLPPATAPVTHTPGGTLIPLPGSSVPIITAGGTTTAGRISSAHITTFGIPHRINLAIFDGSDWATWAGTMEAILVLHEADDVIIHDTCPLGTPVDKWAQVARRAKAYLRLYIKPDVFSLIASEIDFPTFKSNGIICATLMVAGPAP